VQDTFFIDLRKLAAHLGFSYGTVTKMVKAGEIPGKAFKTGKNIRWRFKLSVVDAAMQGADGER
jgi:excisionase family DNA binding protein